MLNSTSISKEKVKSRLSRISWELVSGKNNLLAFALTAIFLKLLFTPQFASAQSSRLWGTYYNVGTSHNLGANYGSPTSNTEVATDVAGNVYLAGSVTDSFGIAAGGFQNSIGGSNDAFLVKFDASGNRIWATYYGGTGDEYSESVATDAAGNVYLAGSTNSDSGIASGGFQNTCGGRYGSTNAFLVKFDANGNRLWATYYGGMVSTTAWGITTDAAGNVFMTGETSDTGLAWKGFQNIYSGANYNAENAFLVKFDANGNRLWATYYGYGDTIGGLDGTTGLSVATDSAGNVYMGGITSNIHSIASEGFLNIYTGYYDAFLVKFDANGNRLWATYYGGGGKTTGSSAATDAAGNVYLAGTTYSYNGIASGGFQNTYGGGSGERFGDLYLVKFNGAGNRLWATYYGGPDEEETATTATDALGNVYLGGHTESHTGIASGGFDNTFAGVENMLVVKFDSAGNRCCATYYAPDPGDIEGGYIAVDAASGNVYLANATNADTGIASGGFENNFGSSAAAFYLVKFTSCTCPGPPPVANFQSSESTFCSYECINYSDLSTNDAASWQWSFPGGTPSSSTLQNPQGICYDSAGTFNSRLIASNSHGSDTITHTNYVKVYASPPTPVITQHHDTLFCATDPTYTSYQWYDSTAIIPGATDTILVVAHSGNYSVKVTNEYGCNNTVSTNINNVGIDEFSANNYISLYPNPASDQLLIHISSSRITGKATISIINILGQTVLSFPWGVRRTPDSFGEASLDIKNIPPGIYFLQMKTDNGIDTKRFVKE